MRKLNTREASKQLRNYKIVNLYYIIGYTVYSIYSILKLKYRNNLLSDLYLYHNLSNTILFPIYLRKRTLYPNLPFPLCVYY